MGGPGARQVPTPDLVLGHALLHPRPGAEPIAGLDLTRHGRDRVDLEADGSFTCRLPRVGDVEVLAWRQDVGPIERRVPFAGLPADRLWLDLAFEVPDMVLVSGRVLREDGEPVDRGRAFSGGTSESFPRWWSRSRFRGPEVSRTGTFSLEVPCDAAVVLTVLSPERAPRHVDLGTGQRPVSGLEIRLARRMAPSFVVLEGVEGEPLAAGVSVSVPTALASNALFWQETLTEGGRLDATWFEPGTRTILSGIVDGGRELWGAPRLLRFEREIEWQGQPSVRLESRDLSPTRGRYLGG